MHFRLLGHLEVVNRETSLALGGIRSRATLGYLLLNHNSLIPVSRLMKALWPSGTPATGRKMLHNAISHLRGVIGMNSMTAGAPVLLTHAPGYFLRVQPESVDMICFEQQVEAARDDLAAGRWEQAAGTLRDALTLWRGPALVDLVEAGVNWTELTALENVRLTAIECLVEADLSMGRHAQVISELETQLQTGPLRERMAGQLMRALYHCGRQSDALAIYQRTRTALIEEFGLDPSPELQQLERAILNHDLTPGAPATPDTEPIILKEPAPPPPVPPPPALVPPPAVPGAPDAPDDPAGRSPRAGDAPEIKQISVVLVRALEETAQSPDPAPGALTHEHITQVVEAEAARCGGTMAGMLGSLWMVVFGVPATGEFDAWYATRTARAISDRLAWQSPDGGDRVGTVVVATGKALIRPLEGALPAVTGAAFDRAMAQLIAARPGEVSICKQTTAASRATERRTLPLRDTPSGAAAEPFVGRDHDMRILQHSWSQARRLNRPHLTTVLGSAGMGKTRLLAEFIARVSAADPAAECLVGSCDPTAPDGTGLEALGDVVKACCGIAPDEDESRTRAGLASAVAGLPGLSQPDRVLGHLCDLVTGTTDSGRDAVAAWCSFLEAATAGHPTVLIVEDVHRAADSVLDLVDRLAGSTGPASLLTIVTARPEALLNRRPGWGGGKRYASTTVLQALDDCDIRDLAAARLGHRSRGVAPASVDAVVAKAGGNPLFGLELAGMLAHAPDRPAGTVRQATGSTSLSLRLPPAVRTVLDAQIDALPPVARTVLLDAVVLGAAFSEDAVAALGSVSAADAKHGVQHLENLDLLVRTGRVSASGRPEYEFRISALRDAAYERHVPAVREQKQRIAAEWLCRLLELDEPAYQR
ncbi:BTAD domain-containing putative transcriptional regulator [Solwaraspora sp. WMMD937]|uniref:BTAD domain-containing putative transcriptional regulator n=1 Tax=Solwaraspora sp. WMMD937 TaxID=3016090 RepID=UPI00249C817A|nr:BTAD domain-containing putative transcriptional regulator [Solwaraspora sp. WMMD937]WFE22955.1 BTAD domain-containing putative transcriptional regulator [Solwaraspora sp. WMMD937]